MQGFLALQGIYYSSYISIRALSQGFSIALSNMQCPALLLLLLLLSTVVSVRAAPNWSQA